MKTLRRCLAAFCLGASLLLPLVGGSVATAAVVEKQAVRNVSVDEAEKLVSAKDAPVVLDVRTPREFRGGHLKGATLINFYDADFAEQVAKLDKSKTYLVFCAVGGRSAQACARMTSLGFTNLINVEGGMKAWEKAGKPTVK